MTKFKIGDKVRYVGAPYGNIKEGDIGEVVSFWRNHSGQVETDVPYPYHVRFMAEPNGEGLLFGDDELGAVDE